TDLPGKLLIEDPTAVHRPDRPVCNPSRPLSDTLRCLEYLISSTFLQLSLQMPYFLIPSFSPWELLYHYCSTAMKEMKKYSNFFCDFGSGHNASYLGLYPHAETGKALKFLAGKNYRITLTPLSHHL